MEDLLSKEVKRLVLITLMLNRWRWPTVNGPKLINEHPQLGLSWCGEPLTVHNLKGICRFHSPKLAFLFEIKNREAFVKKPTRKCGLYNFIFVDPKGLSGGLCLSWDTSCMVNVISMDSFYIHVSI